MPRFHVKDTFEIPDRKLFVLAGSIVEGQIKTGMVVRIPLSSSHGVRLHIHSIEFARRAGSEDVCLCIWSGPNFAEALRGINIGGGTYDVTPD